MLPARAFAEPEKRPILEPGRPTIRIHPRLRGLADETLADTRRWTGHVEIEPRLFPVLDLIGELLAVRCPVDVDEKNFGSRIGIGVNPDRRAADDSNDA